MAASNAIRSVSNFRHVTKLREIRDRVTVGITLDLMPRLNAAADRLYLSRAAFINMAIRRALDEAER